MSLKIFCFFLLSTSFALAAKVQIAVFDSSIKHPHGKAVHNFLTKNLKSCKTCKIKHFTIYKDSGELDHTAFLKGLKSIDKTYRIVHLSWNLPYTTAFDPIIQEMDRIAADGITIVAAAGESQERNEIALPLHDTVMGKVRKAILVGELDKKGKLPLSAFFGPEMKVKYPSVPDKPGSSFTAVIETAKTALAYSLESD